jgi:cytochrome P450
MTSIDDPAVASVEDLAPHLDLFDPSHSERLWEVLSYARSACPVLKTDADEGYYIVTRYDELRTVLEDAETYSSVQAGLRGVPIPMPPLTEDPPRHIEYRRALNKYLSRSFLSRYADDIRDAARTLLDELVPRGRFDFMTDYAVPFTSGNLASFLMTATPSGSSGRSPSRRGSAARATLRPSSTWPRWPRSSCATGRPPATSGTTCCRRS